MSQKDAFRIFWEKQDSGFCGVHCLNNLLQGPYYTEWDLAQIGQQLQDEERKLMAESGVDSAEFLSFMAKESSHVDDGGNFSIEVLKKGLASMNIQIVAVGSEQARDVVKNATKELAFICNLSNHWFAVRKLGDAWYNLNSLLKSGPELITDFYLSEFLYQLVAEKYSLFVVRGQFPAPNESLNNAVAGRGRWFNAADVRKKGVKQRPSSSSQRPVNADADLETAIAMSLSTYSEQPPKDDLKEPPRRDGEDDLEFAIRLSLDKPASSNTSAAAASSSSSSSTSTSSTVSQPPPPTTATTTAASTTGTATTRTT